MNAADIVGLVIIILFSAMGVFTGSIRCIISFVGLLVASNVTGRMLAQGTTQGAFVGTFLGIFVGISLLGALFYGYTKATLIESMEGMIGFFFAFMIGWGVARFVFTIFLYFKPESNFALMITPSALIAWDIYKVSPYLTFMDLTKRLDIKLD
jgi:hypothetical protein